MAADDDLVCPCPIELMAGFVPLAEEITDETLGALVQGLEVVGELGVGILAEIKNWSDADQEGSISGEEKHLTRDGDGAVEECQRNPHRHTCC